MRERPNSPAAAFVTAFGATRGLYAALREHAPEPRVGAAPELRGLHCRPLAGPAVHAACLIAAVAYAEEAGRLAESPM
jgi:hypothetical protein